ncbi:hypothetical protein Tco_0109251 [Tanacetum coccineum]
MVMLFRWWWVRLWWPVMVVAAVAAVVRRWRWCGRRNGVVTKQWRWGSGDDGEARGGEWWSRSGRSVEDLSFYIFWVRRSLAGKVAGGGGGGRNNSPEKMEEEDDVCVCRIFVIERGRG